MAKYNEKISDHSVWLTATPSPIAMTLPFYITEAGHFSAEQDYIVERNEHDSHLLLYTVSGCGTLIAGDTEMTLDNNHAAVVDCRNYHKYFSKSRTWEFFWIHFSGTAVQTFFDILYPSKETAVRIQDAKLFCDKLSLIISKAKKNDVSGSVALSSGMHDLFRILVHSAMENEQKSRHSEYEEDIDSAVEFIKTQYSQNITVDDIIQELHISKYHFIRLFSRIMGVTPYSYLTAYRINVSKMLLRTTDKSISEIAQQCGFFDTSNFINHFKKRTGQRPLQYRRDFT